MNTAAQIVTVGASVGCLWFGAQAVWYAVSVAKLASRDTYRSSKEFHRVMGFDGKFPSRREFNAQRREMDALFSKALRYPEVSK